MATAVRRSLGVLLLCSLYATAHPAHAHDERNHVDSFNRGLPTTWYHDEDHPVNALFKRQNPMPTPGTAEWAAQYPPPTVGSLTVDHIPQAWLDALHAAEAAGLIPDIPVTTLPSDGSSPQYPNGSDPTSPEICSSTAKCRMPDDVWDAKDNTVSIGFDDGPEEGSELLYDFLEQNNIPSTHFMIGGNIIWGYGNFQRAFNELKADIAVHTWDHRYMTSLSNEIALAQLAWTMQIIADSTGGRIPKFWRPPYGDSDNRIRAIAKQILGLTQINWNQDSQDWTIASGKTTLPAVEAAISGWYAGPKSPGLIILEHELTTNTSGAFINTFPEIAKNGWQIASTVQLEGGSWKNAESNTGSVKQMDIILPQPSVTSTQVSSVSPVNNQVATGTDGTSNAQQTAKPPGSTSPSPTPVPVKVQETSSASRIPFTTASSFGLTLASFIFTLSFYL